MTEDITDNLNNIQDECNEIEEKVDPKKVRTYGDPIVQFKD